MPLTNAGRNLVASLLAGTGTPFDSNHASLVVGTGATAFDPAQTDLVGPTTYRKAVSSTYPQVTGNVLTFQSTFATDEANFDWREWGVSNGTTLLNRKVESLGTKANTQAWQLTVQLTISSS